MRRMNKPWSISTTVRNPERLRYFLSVLKILEGEEFNEDCQKKYQIILIQKKLYIPTNIPSEYTEYYKYAAKSMPIHVATKIFEYQNYRDPPMRGRQSVNPLNKLGFAIARKGYGKVKITKLGDLFLKGDYDISFVFFKSLMKLQFPNQWSGDYEEKDGFNITPFIAILHLMYRLNNLCKRGGLTKEEFSLFVPTLINYNNIDEQVERILHYRKFKNKEDKRVFTNNYLKKFYGTDDVSIKKMKNLLDYGDNTIRYLRLTKYFQVKTDILGSHWWIELEPSRMTEIEQILRLYDGSSLKFKNSKEYIEWISNIDKPELPWEEVSNLRTIATGLKKMVSEYKKNSKISFSEEESRLIDQGIELFSKEDLNHYIANLRTLNMNLKIKVRKIELRHNKQQINEAIMVLDDLKQIKKLDPETFEMLVKDILLMIDDELLIKPNYPVDDSGEPISHAPGNKADIECYYKSFNAICEVTLDSSNMQWVREGQPVMRHLRQFESVNGNKEAICLFVAPIIKGDTYSTFFTAVKYGYDGKKQKIVPITTNQLAEILRRLLECLNEEEKFTHEKLLELFNKIVDVDLVDGFSKWTNEIQSVVGI